MSFVPAFPIFPGCVGEGGVVCVEAGPAGFSSGATAVGGGAGAFAPGVDLFLQTAVPAGAVAVVGFAFGWV